MQTVSRPGRYNGARWLMLGLVLALGAGWKLAGAVVDPSKVDGDIARTVGYFLERVHLSRKPLNDELSRAFFAAYLKALDPGKMYFFKKDVQEFQAHETDLDDQIKRGDVTFASTVFQRYLERARQRVDLAQQLLSQPLDFSKDESLTIDPDLLDYPATPEEVRDRWLKRVKYEVLREQFARDASSYEDAVERVKKRYRSFLKSIEQTRPSEMLETYLSALAGVYDPHSSYMSADSYEDFNISMRLHLEGIGAQLRWEDGYTIVDKVLPGGPAARDGRLKPGDRIIGVAQGSGEFEDVIDRRLLPSGQEKPVIYELVREKVDIETEEAKGQIIEYDRKANGQPYRFGVVRLPSFYLDIAAENAGRDDAKKTSRDVQAILEQFAASARLDGRPLDGVILDLRFNGGGALSEAIRLVSLFIDKGPVVQVKNYDGKVRVYRDTHPGTAYDGPLMVLVNRFSASASEIFAGAMQDYQRALIVGDEHTHGKGTVQTVVDLDHRRGNDEEARPTLGALKITIQEFYRVNGDSTQNRGVESDIILPSPYDHMEIGERYLDHALPFSQVKPQDHSTLGLVTPDIVQTLRERSQARLGQSAEFQRLIRRIEVLERRRQRKTIPLQVDKYRAEVELGPDEEEKLREKLNGVADEKVFDTSDFYNREVLAIMKDYVDLLHQRQIPAASVRAAEP
jgi:carboxyl-terminal processing protease